MPDLEDLVTLNTAAELMQVHPRTIRNWTRAGKLTAYQLPGGRLRIDRNELRSKVATIPADQIPA